MAITKIGAMTDPPVAGDYTILQAKLDAYAKQIGNQGMILTQWTNTTTAPKIAMGSYITHGGTLFVVDTEDYAVTEPAGDGTYYLKVSISGDTLALAWIASLSGYTWNAIYNGLYHADESQILPYQLVKAGAVLTKRKITNLMQGSGFVTVDYLGNISGGAISCETVNTGQGANELYAMNQNVRTTDDVGFNTVSITGNQVKSFSFTTSDTEHDVFTAIQSFLGVTAGTFSATGVTNGRICYIVVFVSTTIIRVFSLSTTAAVTSVTYTGGSTNAIPNDIDLIVYKRGV